MGPSHGDPLALAARQSTRLAVERWSIWRISAAEAEAAARDLRFVGAAHLEAEGHVVPDRHVRIERVVWKTMRCRGHGRVRR